MTEWLKHALDWSNGVSLTEGLKRALDWSSGVSLTEGLKHARGWSSGVSLTEGLKRTLDWISGVSLTEGLKRTLDWSIYWKETIWENEIESFQPASEMVFRKYIGDFHCVKSVCIRSFYVFFTFDGVLF